MNENIAKELVKIAHELLAVTEFPFDLIQNGQADVRKLRDKLKKIKVSDESIEKNMKIVINSLDKTYEQLTSLRANARRKGL